jgi:hypothetical protein
VQLARQGNKENKEKEERKKKNSGSASEAEEGRPFVDPLPRLVTVRIRICEKGLLVPLGKGELSRFEVTGQGCSAEGCRQWTCPAKPTTRTTWMTLLPTL